MENQTIGTYENIFVNHHSYIGHICNDFTFSRSMHTVMFIN